MVESQVGYYYNIHLDSFDTTTIDEAAKVLCQNSIQGE